MSTANKYTRIIRPSQAPSVIEAEAFFEQLPSNAWSRNEKELVHLLEQITWLAQKWLPHDVSIRAWLRKRCANEDFAWLMCEDGNTEQKPSSQVYPPPASGREDQIFWDSLPQAPELLHWERTLQRQLEYAIGSARREGTHRGNPKLIKDIAQRPNIAECTEMNLPKTVTLETWISKRMSSAFHVSHVGTDAYVEACGGEKRAQQRAEYLEKLIGTILTSKEVKLRDEIVEFVTKEWPEKKKGRPPTTNDLDLCASVQKMRQEILPSYVSLKDWCEARMHGDIEFYQAVNEAGAPIAIFVTGCVDTKAAKAMSENYLDPKRKANDGKRKRCDSHPKKKAGYWQNGWHNNERW